MSVANLSGNSQASNFTFKQIIPNCALFSTYIVVLKHNTLIHSFIHLYNKFYYAPGILLDTGDRAVNKTVKKLCTVVYTM